VQVLAIGLKEQENEELERWQETRGFKAWVAATALAGLRVFEEFEPDVVILATILSDMDSVRLARTFQAWKPSLRIVFVGAHRIEASYFSSIDGLPGVQFTNRPLDPEVALSLPARAQVIDGVAMRGALSVSALGAFFASARRNELHGALYAGADLHRRVVYFDSGVPSYASSMVASETLGQMLLRSGRITRVEFDWVRNLQAVKGILQGVALTKIGVLNESELDSLLRSQMSEKMYLLAAMEGEPWHFETWTHPLRHPQRYAFNPVQVLVEGATRANSFRSLDADQSLRLAELHADPVLDAFTECVSTPVLNALQGGASAQQLAPLTDGIERARAIVGVARSMGLAAS
jgi:CheY-like chemotaxis protein